MKIFKKLLSRALSFMVVSLLYIPNTYAIREFDAEVNLVVLAKSLEETSIVLKALLNTSSESSVFKNVPGKSSPQFNFSDFTSVSPKSESCRFFDPSKLRSPSGTFLCDSCDVDADGSFITHYHINISQYPFRSPEELSRRPEVSNAIRQSDVIFTIFDTWDSKDFDVSNVKRVHETLVSLSSYSNSFKVYVENLYNPPGLPPNTGYRLSPAHSFLEGLRENRIEGVDPSSSDDEICNCALSIFNPLVADFSFSSHPIFSWGPMLHGRADKLVSHPPAHSDVCRPAVPSSGAVKKGYEKDHKVAEQPQEHCSEINLFVLGRSEAQISQVIRSLFDTSPTAPLFKPGPDSTYQFNFSSFEENLPPTASLPFNDELPQPPRPFCCDGYGLDDTGKPSITHYRVNIEQRYFTSIGELENFKDVIKKSDVIITVFDSGNKHDFNEENVRRIYEILTSDRRPRYYICIGYNLSTDSIHFSWVDMCLKDLFGGSNEYYYISDFFPAQSGLISTLNKFIFGKGKECHEQARSVSTYLFHPSRWYSSGRWAPWSLK